MQFLLERLANPPLSAFGQFEPFDMQAAIAAQIQRIVSARVVEAAGGEMSLLEFGMPNVVELGMSSKSQLERYAAQLTRLIVRYEPRLRSPWVQVQPTGQPLTPYRIVVSGSLASQDEPEIFHFELPTY